MIPAFNAHEVVQRRKEALKARLDRAMALVLNDLGLELVRTARLLHSYQDQTGNLTNSIGYVVIRRKSVVAQGGELKSGAGADEAKEVCMRIAAESKYDWTLAIVAGMEYAAYVEAKGYNVLMPAELKAQRDFGPAMRKLIAKYDERLSNILKS